MTYKAIWIFLLKKCDDRKKDLAFQLIKITELNYPGVGILKHLDGGFFFFFAKFGRRYYDADVMEETASLTYLIGIDRINL